VPDKVPVALEFGTLTSCIFNFWAASRMGKQKRTIILRYVLEKRVECILKR
jgi:hypothetical protein